MKNIKKYAIAHLIYCLIAITTILRIAWSLEAEYLESIENPEQVLPGTIDFFVKHKDVLVTTGTIVYFNAEIESVYKNDNKYPLFSMKAISEKFNNLTYLEVTGVIYSKEFKSPLDAWAAIVPFKNIGDKCAVVGKVTKVKSKNREYLKANNRDRDDDFEVIYNHITVTVYAMEDENGTAVWFKDRDARADQPQVGAILAFSQEAWKANKIAIRIAPTSNSQLVVRLEKTVAGWPPSLPPTDYFFIIKNEKNGWYEVETLSETKGWVLSKDVEEVKDGEGLLQVGDSFEKTKDFKRALKAYEFCLSVSNKYNQRNTAFNAFRRSRKLERELLSEPEPEE